MTEYHIPPKTSGDDYSKCPNCKVQKVAEMYQTTEKLSPESIKFAYAPYCYKCGIKLPNRR